MQRKPPSLTTLSNILTFDIARSKYSAASSNDSLEQRICPMATKALTSSGSFSIAILLQTKVLVRLLVYPVKFRGKITEDDNFASTKESTLLCHLNKGRALSWWPAAKYSREIYKSFQTQKRVRHMWKLRISSVKLMHINYQILTSSNFSGDRVSAGIPRCKISWLSGVTFSVDILFKNFSGAKPKKLRIGGFLRDNCCKIHCLVK